MRERYVSDWRWLTFGLDKCGNVKKGKKKTERDIIVCWIIPGGRPCRAAINRGGAWWTVRCVSRSLALRHVDSPEVKVYFLRAQCEVHVHAVPPAGSYKSPLASCSRSLHLPSLWFSLLHLHPLCTLQVRRRGCARIYCYARGEFHRESVRLP